MSAPIRLARIVVVIMACINAFMFILLTILMPLGYKPTWTYLQLFLNACGGAAIVWLIDHWYG